MKKCSFKLNKLTSATTVLFLYGTVLWASDAMAACAGEPGSITVTGSAQSCSSTVEDLTTINVQNGATVTHTANGDVTITNPTSTDAHGILVKGTLAAKARYSLTTQGDLIIKSGNGTPGSGTWGGLGSGRGITLSDNAQVDITANRVIIETTNGANNNDVASGLRVSGSYGNPASVSNLNINADYVQITTKDKSSGGIAASYGTIKIKGNTGLSMTKVSVSGEDSSAVRAEHRSGGNASRVELELVDLQAVGTGNYIIGMLASGNNASIQFIGGKIETSGANAGTAIRTRELSTLEATGYVNQSLAISTDGIDSRGVRATGASRVTLNSGRHASFVTTIHTKGTISDGLNAGRLKHSGEIGAESANSSITIHGETHITTDSASSYGLRLIGDGATINLLGVDGQGRSSLHSKSTAVRYGFGNGYSKNADGSITVNPQTMTLENIDITHEGQAGQFVLANDRNSFLCRLSGSLCDNNGNNTWASGNLIQVGDRSGDVGVQGQGGYAITVADAVVGGVLNLNNSTATAIDGRDLINVTYGGGTTLVPDKKSSSFTLNAADGTVLKGSAFTDQTLDASDNTSTLNMRLSGQSMWFIARDSNVTHLDVDRSHVYLNRYEDWFSGAGAAVATQPAAYATLRANTLTGNNSTFYFNSNVITGATDKLIISEVDGATGTHYAFVKNDGSQATVGTETLTIIETQGGGAQFLSGQTLPNGSTAPRKIELGGYLYDLRQKEGTNDWEIYSTGAKPIDPVYPPKPPITSTANAAANILNTGYLVNYVDTQTLLQRMGELRNTQGHEGDFWIRGFTGKLNSFGSAKLSGFDMSYNGMQIGVDRQLDLGQGNVYIGVMAGYTEGSPDFNSWNNASGTIKSSHVGLYGTYTDENTGIYVDGLLKYIRMKHDFSAIDTAGMQVKGDGRTNGYNLSLEAGKRFNPMQSAPAFYIEPQVQLSYGNQGGRTIHATNGLRIRLDDYTSLQGRASVIWGYQLQGNDNPTNLYLKTGYIKEFHNNSVYYLNGSREKNDFGGGWVDVGIGLSTTFNKRHHLYTELDYSDGSKFNRRQFNLGYRFEF